VSHAAVGWSKPASPDVRLSMSTKILYGVGEITNGIKIVTLGLYSVFFATSVLGLPGTWIGAVGFLAMLWDAFIDPFIGYLTDGRHAARRHALMLTGALTMGLGYWAFFAPPTGLSNTLLFAWLLVASFVLRTATSMFSIPYYAEGAGLTRDYHERTSITAIRGLTAALGTLLTASLSFVLFFREKTPGVDPKLERSGYAQMGIAFGLVMSTAALVSLWSMKRARQEATSAEVPTEDRPSAFITTIWSYLQNRSCRTVLLASSLVTIGLAINSAVLLHYVKHYAKIEGSVALTVSQASFFCAGIAGTIVWSRFARRFQKHRLFVFSTILTSLVIGSGYLLFGEGSLFGTGDARPLFVGCGLAGFFNCILWFIPQSMLADVADESELLTGKRREGALFGLNSLTQQTASGIAILATGVLLDRYVGLIPGGGQQSSTTAVRIAVVYSLVPAFLFLLAAALMRGYTLTGSRLQDIQAQLNGRGASSGELSSSGDNNLYASN